MKCVAVAFFLGYLAFAACQEEKLDVNGNVNVDLAKVDISTVEVASAKEAAASALQTVSKVVSGAFSDIPQPELTLSRRLPNCRRPRPCTRDYRPVCAYSICRGLQTFTNRCQLLAFNRCNYPGYVEIFSGSCDRFINCRQISFYDFIDLPVPIDRPIIDFPISVDPIWELKAEVSA